MLKCRVRSCAAAASLLLMLFPGAASVWALGYYNVPGNCCQWWGYGCGAGYHAPLVLGPVSGRGCCAHGIIRLPYSPCPPCGDGCYGRTNCDNGCSFAEPSTLEPTAAPLPLPAPENGPDPAPSAFRIPFRY